MKRLLSFILALLCIVSLTGCSGANSRDLMRGVTPRELSAKPALSDSGNLAVTDFALRLMQACDDGEKTTILSPLSVLYALGMTVNGAVGETKAQMEAVLGMRTEEINHWLSTYLSQLPQDKKFKLLAANSIWLTEDESFTVQPDFLQTNADYYGAGIYAAPFNNSTVRDINHWVKQNTDGMIDSILDSIPEEAVMYLINTLAFEAEWMEIYEKYQVREGTFTCEDGTVQQTELMHSDESFYLSCDSAEGFLKLYKGKYAFAALLPREGVTVSECLASLDGQTLRTMLSQPKGASVEAAIPKFDAQSDLELSEVLAAMGMSDAFDWTRADFSALGSSTEGNIVINRVLHKTFLSVAEKGTRAGAVTAVEMLAESAAPPKDFHRIILDRPFICMLVDTENDIPFFIGTVMSVGK